MERCSQLFPLNRNVLGPGNILSNFNEKSLWWSQVKVLKALTAPQRKPSGLSNLIRVVCMEQRSKTRQKWGAEAAGEPPLREMDATSWIRNISRTMPGTVSRRYLLAAHYALKWSNKWLTFSWVLLPSNLEPKWTVLSSPLSFKYKTKPNKNQTPNSLFPFNPHLNLLVV